MMKSSPRNFAYSKKSFEELNECRFALFQRSTSNDLKILPPSADALFLHSSRCAYQAGWVWGNTITQIPPPPTELWGWMLHKGVLHFQWTSNDSHIDIEYAVCVCRCALLKCSSCKCAKKIVKCLTYCACARKCEFF